MATYKLIQDIEAEDHILGPLTLRQFIFALIAVFCYYICFIALTKHVAFLLLFFLPPGLFFTFFAFPFGRDQPTEIWALAKIRYYIKPRQRVWNQSGIKELVTITVPKKVERVLTDGLSHSEVESRLKALANTIDSRGWAIKNVNVNAFSQPDPTAVMESDRLIDMSSIPQEVPNIDIKASDDMLDEHSNPVAQQFDHMMAASEQAHRQQLVNQMNSPATQAPPAATNAGPPPNYWFMNQPAPSGAVPADQSVFANATVIQPGSTDTQVITPGVDAPTEAAMAAELKSHHAPSQTSYTHMRTLQPATAQPPAGPGPTASQTAQPTVTPPSDPAILSLANNNDLNVATLARQAHKAKGDDGSLENEVVIPLH
ncbi:MAG TPA: PrgI family protein [Candidatus Saccharimonadales bacterium]